MRLKCLFALVLAAAWAGPALATGDARSADRRFDELDRNHDGFLSRDEANDARELQARFSELDANNDGKLSRAEYRVASAGEHAALPGAPTAANGATQQ